LPTLNAEESNIGTLRLIVILETSTAKGALSLKVTLLDVGLTFEDLRKQTAAAV